MKNIIIVAITIIFTSCGDSELKQEIEVDSELLYRSIEVLTSDSLSGRRAGSGCDLKSANYIFHKLSVAGLVPLFKDRPLVEFEIPKNSVDMYNLDTNISYNVAMIIRCGIDDADAVVLGAHYDHLGVASKTSLRARKGDIFPGANDNASGVSSLIELSRLLFMRKDKFKHDLIVIAFGAEELGNIGSKDIVTVLRDSAIEVKHMVNLEMLGNMSGDSLYLMGDVSFEEMDKIVAQTVNIDSITIVVGGHMTMASDHAAFYENKIPVSLFVSGSDNYHMSSDDIDAINFDGLIKANRYIENYIMSLLESEVLPSFKEGGS